MDAAPRDATELLIDAGKGDAGGVLRAPAAPVEGTAS